MPFTNGFYTNFYYIFINKGSRTRTKVSPNVPNLPSNDEITRFDGTDTVGELPGYPVQNSLSGLFLF